MTRDGAPVRVVAAALLDEAGRVCLQRRPQHKQHGGLWEFPGGKVEAGEGPATALCRELAEELAVCVDPAGLEPCALATGGGIEIALYLVRSWTGTPCPVESEQLVWLDPGQVAGLAMPPLDYPLAAQLVSHLSTSAI